MKTVSAIVLLLGLQIATYVSPDAIEWLLLEVTGAAAGPTDGDRLLAASFIQRVNTAGGKEPALACTAAILNQRQLVPYEADYILGSKFYLRAGLLQRAW